MNNIEKLGFDSWFIDKVDLSKISNLKTSRGIAKQYQNEGGSGRLVETDFY